MENFIGYIKSDTKGVYLVYFPLHTGKGLSKKFSSAGSLFQESLIDSLLCSRLYCAKRI